MSALRQPQSQAGEGQGGIADPAFKVLMANAKAMKRGRLSVWTVYKTPLDHHDGFLARRFESGKAAPTPTEDTVTGKLEGLRDIFTRAGLIKQIRDEGDEPQIVETWI